ncbi:hypothetical protein CTAYLR_006827 [Chrysophaeum taylorii]|uniref:C3H1-type domain-containing protein n=1 Tax=Chrysophaeum taylorii TaxID=2483200 RepID=A0AAD7UBB7_9STRA|nr:hypothetical protein CTAYLR_006827 [Chrysophaeum taylorii]
MATTTTTVVAKSEEKEKVLWPADGIPRIGNADEFDHITFDFEAYVEELLPQLNAPGPHWSAEARKAAVEAAAASAPPGMSIQKLEEKYRTVVCRHWLRGLCMKGEQCEFLHQYDTDRMPVCRWGTSCQIPDCPYRHVAEDDKPQCVFYQQGFCIHGLLCKYRHVKQPPEKRPKIADFSLGIAQKSRQADGAPQNARNPPNEYYKIALCKHHMLGGMCPFGDECHFAHGSHELRPFRGRGGGRQQQQQQLQQQQQQ